MVKLTAEEVQKGFEACEGAEECTYDCSGCGLGAPRVAELNSMLKYSRFGIQDAIVKMEADLIKLRAAATEEVAEQIDSALDHTKQAIELLTKAIKATE